MFAFSSEKYADLNFAHGFHNGNPNVATKEFQKRIPEQSIQFKVPRK
jgi:hypothetical protein